MKKSLYVANMIKCPGCSLKLPEHDLQAQKTHMQEKHPKIIAERHRSAGIPPKQSSMSLENHFNR